MMLGTTLRRLASYCIAEYVFGSTGEMQLLTSVLQIRMQEHSI